MGFQYEPNEAVRPLLETFRMMVNRALWIGIHGRIRGRFKLIRAVYNEFKRYGLHTHYTLSACEVASAILKNQKRNHRAPVAKRLSLKLDNQAYNEAKTSRHIEAQDWQVPTTLPAGFIVETRIDNTDGKQSSWWLSRRQN